MAPRRRGSACGGGLDATLAQLGRDDERAQLLIEIPPARSTDPTRRGTALLAASRLRQERAGRVEAATKACIGQVMSLWARRRVRARESRASTCWRGAGAAGRARRGAARRGARALDSPVARRALREAAWVLEVRIKDVASAAAVYEEWLQRLPDDRTALVTRRGTHPPMFAIATARSPRASARDTRISIRTPEVQWLRRACPKARPRSVHAISRARNFRRVREEPSVAARRPPADRRGGGRGRGATP